MKRILAVCSVLTLALVLVPAVASAQNSLTLDSDSVQGLETKTLGVNMTNDAPVEGFVLAVGYDTMLISVMDVSILGTVTEANGAELVVPEIFEAMGGFTLGVVMDAEGPPFDGQTIPVGGGEIANFKVMADVIVPMPGPTTTTLDFTDGTFNNPPLDNIIVQGGFSIGAGQGLGLNNGTLDLFPPPPDQLFIASVSGPGNEEQCVPVTLDLSSGPCQGYVLAISHDAAVVTLNSIELGAAADAVGAEFVVPNTNPGGGDGGTLGVVLDFNPPFGGQTIAPGNGLEVAQYCYSCVNVVVISEGDPVPPPECSPLTFVDGTLGSPALDNVIVVAGLSLSPAQNNGEVCCEAIVVAAEDTTFRCGVENAEGEIVDAVGSPGDTVAMCFYYTEGSDPNPGDGIPECVGDNIQGFQLALCFDCNLTCVEGSFSIEGSILEAVGAEFVTSSCDNDPNDGDGCELTIGILLDALPPFDRQTAPPTCDPLLIGCVDFVINEDAPCNTCLPVEFCDGVNGGENVPIENIVVINNMSIQNFDTFDCNICVIAEKTFQRGDCNGDTKVDLADASSVLAQQFQGFPVPCLDACDANDDGKINLADTVFILNYLFDSGPPPPDPGPDLDPGTDPTPDNLDCEMGNDTCD